MKRCNNCEQVKHTNAFRKNEWVCRKCRSEERHTLRLKTQYDITPAEVARRLKTQEHACAICQEPFVENEQPLVDHDHATGKVRGLLCHHCNTGIGLLRDNPKLLYRAARYLHAGGT